MEERTEIIKELAPVSLSRGVNPLDITYEEALAALAHPSHLSEDVSPEKAYIYLSQYKDRVQSLLASAIECISNDLKMIDHLEDFIEWGGPSTYEYKTITEGIVQHLQTQKELL